MEEEQARQAAAAAAQGGSAAAAAPAAEPAPSAPAAEPATAPAEPTDDEEDALLKQALAMSEGQEDVDMAVHADGDEDMSEEEAIARAIEMSMKPQEEQEGKDKK